MQYRQKVISGFVWTAGEKFATTAVRILAQVIVLRYLSPGQFGVVALLNVFSFIAFSIIDSGFSQALIRKKDASDRDYNSVFYLNLAIALVLYGGLVAAAGPMARFFGQPQLVSLAPVLFLTIPLSAFSLIQTTILSRAMNFKSLSKISFAATILSSGILIFLAVRGFGPWALVWQAVSTEALKTLLLWITSRWRPGREVSAESVRQLYAFGSRLFLTGIIGQVFSRITTVIIGRMYTSAEVGLYDMSLKFKDSIALALTQSVHSVSYPALASFQDDRAKLTLASRQVVQVLSFLLFPVMTGLVLVAPEGFALAGGEKWIPAIPYFRIFCLSAFFLPLTNAGANIMKARGEGSLILNSEIVKKIFATAVIAFAAFYNVRALAWAYTVWIAFEMAVNCVISRRITGYIFKMQAGDTLPYLAMSAVMFAGVCAMVRLIPTDSVAVIFGVKILAGIIIYTALSAVFRPAAWKECLSIYKNAVKR